MRCPACPNHLVTLELSGVEVDYCFACRGIWLDSGELEALVSREPGGDALVESLRPAETAERRLRCPACGKRMDKVMAAGAETILLDRCATHGFWTDDGELRKILALGCEEGFESPLVRILDNMFPEKKGGCA
jgi:Zn-finger nucleic acid-binding protein